MLLADTTAFSDVVTALGNAINTEAMFANLAALIPVIGGVMLFAFTYRIIKGLVGGAQKGKAKLK